jgi:putative selenate reductase
MEHPFRPAPLDVLARWIFRDLEAGDTVLGIPKANFALPHPRLATRLLGRDLAAPLGLAAGPHTQLAQNIVAGWLCGARFIELKTVQVLDGLTVFRPCIDSHDATFNCEWSQELGIGASFGEYLKAWVLIHVLARRLGLASPGVSFNMSVGYDLAGIRSPKVQTFLASMGDASAALPAAVEAVARAWPGARDVEIPSCLSVHATLSTMHGCPPSEIERIATCLLTEARVHTWVKLNPTLLGPALLRAILNGACGHDIEVPDEAFQHDPSWPEAMAMVRNLARLGGPRAFGLKLSNTLEVVNRSALPRSEARVYMSGRALHPLTVTLAHRVMEELDGQVPISFCGGADAFNFPDLVAAGLGPVTVCTDLLQPGGYARLGQYLSTLEARMDAAGAPDLGAFVEGRTALARLAATVAEDPRGHRREKPLAFKGRRPLGPFDCVAAPCQEACPAGQEIPAYLAQVAQGNPGAALDIILGTNAMPGTTGLVCEQPCAERCVRTFFDAPLAIRELKRFAVEHGRASRPRTAPPLGVRVAVVGAGPAGISAASTLAPMGFEVHLFDARETPGGMPAGVIPGYRLPAPSLQADLDRLEALGVHFHGGQALGRERSLTGLLRDHAFVFLGVGAARGRRLGLAGEDAPGVTDALAFLERARKGEPMALGSRVVVVGGGNSALDAARTALRLGAQVTLAYRRTRDRMPADPAEVRDALEEGLVLRELLSPAALLLDGSGRLEALACDPMRAGEPDASGRPRPVPAGGPPVVLPADTLIAALGQEPVLDFLEDLPVPFGPGGTLAVDPATRETAVPGLFAGGDAVRGPASVVAALADGRAAALEMGRRHGVAPLPAPLPAPMPDAPKGAAYAATLARKALRVAPVTVPVLPLDRRGGFDPVVLPLDAESAVREASRCLACHEVCSLCVTVCPNRANLAYLREPLALHLPLLEMKDGRLVPGPLGLHRVVQKVQVLNLADFCNACGNCGTFCPTAGNPSGDKPRFWLDREGFEADPADAFHGSRNGALTRLEGRIGGVRVSLEVEGDEARYRSPRILATLDPRTWTLRSAEPLEGLMEHATEDLAPCATLIALTAALAALPGEG